MTEIRNTAAAGTGAVRSDYHDPARWPGPEPMDDRHWWSTGETEHELTALIRSLDHSTVLILADEQVPGPWGRIADSLGDRAVYARIPAGEQAKTLPNVLDLVSTWQRHLDRDSLVIAIGGGTTLDLVGLATGLLWRGVRYLTVPTSMIALADAAYGGKTAVNHHAKNQLGMYHQPVAVYSNPRLLWSLPDEHWHAGMIEVVKLSFFHGDIAQHLGWYHAGNAPADPAIRAAAETKLRLMAEDPYERKAGAALLYGHPFGNVFEQHTAENLHGVLHHGHAVALGISLTAWLSDTLADDNHGIAGAFTRRLAPSRTDAVNRHVPLGPLAADLPDVDVFREMLGRDKYASRDSIAIPGLRGPRFTTTSLDSVIEQYQPWQDWLHARTTA